MTMCTNIYRLLWVLNVRCTLCVSYLSFDGLLHCSVSVLIIFKIYPNGPTTMSITRNDNGNIICVIYLYKVTGTLPWRTLKKLNQKTRFARPIRNIRNRFQYVLTIDTPYTRYLVTPTVQ